MMDPVVPAVASGAMEDVLAARLAAEERAYAGAGPVLQYLLHNGLGTIFDDEILARVRGMLADCARQLAAALIGPDRASHHGEATVDALIAGLAEQPAVLEHLHALALEWRLALRLRDRAALDPALSPLIQEQIGAANPSVSTLAVNLMAAQARFCQQQRRMQLPLMELPGDVLNRAIRVMQGVAREADADAVQAERIVRTGLDEKRSRLALLRRSVAALGERAGVSLVLAHAGAALFVTALALGAGCSREAAVFATAEGHETRLLLGLIACGLEESAIAAQFLAVHPGGTVPEGLGLVAPERAAALLSGYERS